MRPFRCVAMALLLCISARYEVWAVGYTFTNIVDTSTAAPTATFSAFASPAVSGDRVAFFGTYDRGRGEGIFTSKDSSLTPIALRTETLYLDRYHLSISNDRVAFRGIFGDPGASIFVGAGGPLETVAKTGDVVDTGILGDIAGPVISDDTVAFHGLSPIYSSADGTIRTVARIGDLAPVGTFTSVSPPVIDGHKIAFAASYQDSEESLSGIMIDENRVLTAVVQTGGAAPIGSFGHVTKPAISGDAIAFRGRDGGGFGVFSRNGAGQVSAIVREGDPAPIGVFGELPTFGISAEDVFFFGAYSEPLGSGGEGIFKSRSGITTPVITTGDPLFGSTLIGLFDPGLLNPNIPPTFGIDTDGSGNVAFLYLLDDGRKGVALATPVPEPLFTNILGGSVLLLATKYSRERRRSI